MVRVGVSVVIFLTLQLLRCSNESGKNEENEGSRSNVLLLKGSSVVVAGFLLPALPTCQFVEEGTFLLKLGLAPAAPTAPHGTKQ